MDTFNRAKTYLSMNPGMVMAILIVLVIIVIIVVTMYMKKEKFGGQLTTYGMGTMPYQGGAIALRLQESDQADLRSGLHGWSKAQIADTAIRAERRVRSPIVRRKKETFDETGASFCAPGWSYDPNTKMCYQDLTGAAIIGPDDPTLCPEDIEDWNPAAVLEAQALVQVGSLQPQEYAEKNLSAALNISPDQESRILSPEILAALYRDNETP